MKSNHFDIRIYHFGKLAVRAFKHDEIWFVAQDIADALAYKNIVGFNFLPEKTRRFFSIYAPREKRAFLCINIQAVFHILEHSHSKNIHEFHKWFYDLLGGKIHSQESAYPSGDNDFVLTDGLIQNALVILNTAGVTGKKAAEALDKIFADCTGKSVLEAAGINLKEDKHE